MAWTIMDIIRQNNKFLKALIQARKALALNFRSRNVSGSKKMSSMKLCYRKDKRV